MCVIAAKYIDGTGWVGVKNRDRNYFASVKIKKSYRKQVERIYIWDTLTKYAEGMNAFSISVLSSCLSVKSDEAERELASAKKRAKMERGTFYSPAGLKIRKSLEGRHPEDVLATLIDLKIAGHTLIFNEEQCYLLEGVRARDSQYRPTGEYSYHVKSVSKEECIVRTNHGIAFPDAGYQYGGDNPKPEDRKSSELRKESTERELERAFTVEAILAAASTQYSSNPQYNPIRLDHREGRMCTTGQIALVPSERKLYYRPIIGDVHYNPAMLHSKAATTFFQPLPDFEAINNTIGVAS